MRGTDGSKVHGPARRHILRRAILIGILISSFGAVALATDVINQDNKIYKLKVQSEGKDVYKRQGLSSLGLASPLRTALAISKNRGAS